MNFIKILFKLFGYSKIPLIKMSKYYYNNYSSEHSSEYDSEYDSESNSEYEDEFEANDAFDYPEKEFDDSYYGSDDYPFDSYVPLEKEIEKREYYDGLMEAFFDFCSDKKLTPYEPFFQTLPLNKKVEQVVVEVVPQKPQKTWDVVKKETINIQTIQKEEKLNAEIKASKEWQEVQKKTQDKRFFREKRPPSSSKENEGWEEVKNKKNSSLRYKKK